MADDTFDESNTGPLDLEARAWQSEWRRQGARWGVYAKQRPILSRDRWSKFQEAMIRISEQPYEACQAFRDLGASLNRLAPLVPWYLRPWAWVTDTYYRWRNS